MSLGGLHHNHHYLRRWTSPQKVDVRAGVDYSVVKALRTFTSDYVRKTEGVPVHTDSVLILGPEYSGPDLERWCNFTISCSDFVQHLDHFIALVHTLSLGCRVSSISTRFYNKRFS